MLKIGVKIEEISVRLKMAEKQGKEGFFLEFHRRTNEGKYVLVNEGVELKGQRQALQIQDQMYAKSSEIDQKTVEYKVLVKNGKNSGGSAKFIGGSLLELKDYLNQGQYPLFIRFILPLQKCPDPHAYIKLLITVEDMPEFTQFFSNQNTQNQQQLTHEQIEEEFSRQEVEEKKAQLQRFNQRSLRYQQQIRHLSLQNTELNNEINEREGALKLAGQIHSDKIEAARNKNTKMQRQCVKTKQHISHLVNLINEYGRIDIVQSITDILSS